ncbi:hypothetical protein H6P81_001228 [Aristolochia fimbriata]|uniref:Uncharacterized protein n=1 Tax=Aristolochia fimbriata TaxID=158543 RepID=A0AAV7F695_ARIFI|nr:hypothetical protein H6P81_001228 [Aristolochia fimbriata]
MELEQEAREGGGDPRSSPSTTSLLLPLPWTEKVASLIPLHDTGKEYCLSSINFSSYSLTPSLGGGKVWVKRTILWGHALKLAGGNCGKKGWVFKRKFWGGPNKARAKHGCLFVYQRTTDPADQAIHRDHQNPVSFIRPAHMYIFHS